MPDRVVAEWMLGYTDAMFRLCGEAGYYWSDWDIRPEMLQPGPIVVEEVHNSSDPDVFPGLADFFRKGHLRGLRRVEQFFGFWPRLFESIGCLETLTHVELNLDGYDGPCEPRELLPLAQLSRLESLCIRFWDMNCDVLRQFARLRRLRVLDVGVDLLTDACVEAIASFPSLERIDLSCTSAAPAQVRALRCLGPRLRIKLWAIDLPESEWLKE